MSFPIYGTRGTINGEELKRLPDGQLLVNPYRFYSSVIKDSILVHKQAKRRLFAFAFEDERRSRPFGGDWVRKAVMYSTMIRDERRVGPRPFVQPRFHQFRWTERNRNVRQNARTSAAAQKDGRRHRLYATDLALLAEG
ncbi:MAG: hypothetical protein MZU97_19505 [Bacillus subtilis]|nr:hypothetical protein [Bacillus subtilis]